MKISVQSLFEDYEDDTVELRRDADTARILEKTMAKLPNARKKRPLRLVLIAAAAVAVASVEVAAADLAAAAAVASVEVAAADLAVAAEAASAEDAEKPNPLTQNEKHVCLAGVLFLTLIAA